jgi:nuclear pore complex protein Nup133
VVIARQHGAVYADTGYALALTHTHALVWPYSTDTSSPETFIFALPHASKSSSDPIPLGSLVSNSASSLEPGLVVVMPTTGKITYWESAASATTMDLIRQQRIGVEAAIPGMLSGETVVQLLNAEPAGFLLGFSSGRLGYMTVRDSQGRPSIAVQFLRGTAGSAGTGLFGSLRNVLSSSAWRGDLAAARAGPVSKPGERDIVTATSKGRLQAWNLHRGGHSSLQAEAEIRDPVVQALKESDPSLADRLIETFEILDLAFTPESLPEAESDRPTTGTRLLLLTSFGGKERSHYALVEALLQPEKCEIGVIRHVRSYTTPLNRAALSKPRLHLPKPGLVAFIVLDKAVVVLSMARQPDSPDFQLLAGNEAGVVPGSFEDVIDFRHDRGVEIMGSGMEGPYHLPNGAEEHKSRRHKAKYPAVVLIVRGGGVIRIAATDPYKLTSSQAPQVTAKSKLEQAVFYGALDGNLISFKLRKELSFPPEEMAKAALELSQDIIRCRTPYIPQVAASLDDHLRRRGLALRELALFMKVLKVPLDRLTRWKLLWDAEKVAGATLAWNLYDEAMKGKPVDQRGGIVPDLVWSIHEKQRSEPSPEIGELDRVRHWFIHDIWNMEIAIPWAFQALKVAYQEGDKDHKTVMRLVSEADDFQIGALDGAYAFRQANAALYGLEKEKLENGILKTGYEGLPEFWTSTFFVAESSRRLADLAWALVKEYWPEPSGGEGKPDPETFHKVRLENPRLVDLSIRSNVERGRWCLAQDDEKLRAQGEHHMNSQLRVAEIQVHRLSEIGLVDPAIDLAKSHRVFTALVALVVEELLRLLEVSEHADDEKKAACLLRSEALSAQVDRYYDMFGERFSSALYKYYIRKGDLYALLTDQEDHREHLTNFLRNRPQFAKLAWIHEVTSEQNYDCAAKDLLNLGLRKEQDLWSKKVELSIGKLARLAGKSYSEANGLIIPDGGHVELAETKKQLALIRIQDRVFNHVQSAVGAAIDENAEVQLALEIYGNKKLGGRTALSRLLEENLGRLLSHKAIDVLSLIDLLTLMGQNANSEELDDVAGAEFYLALQALKSGPLDKDERGLTERAIWRRCMLRDDWEDINNTELRGDQEVSDQLRQTALFVTLRACLKNGMCEVNGRLRVVANKLQGCLKNPPHSILSTRETSWARQRKS